MNSKFKTMKVLLMLSNMIKQRIADRDFRSASALISEFMENRQSILSVQGLDWDNWLNLYCFVRNVQHEFEEVSR